MTDANREHHSPTCPAIQAWDIPGACDCDGPDDSAKRYLAEWSERARICGEYFRISESELYAVEKYIEELEAGRDNIVDQLQAQIDTLSEENERLWSYFGVENGGGSDP